jgi:hypothetical protein
MREDVCTFDFRDDNSIGYNRGSEAGMEYDTTGVGPDSKVVHLSVSWRILMQVRRCRSSLLLRSSSPCLLQSRYGLPL